MTRCSRESVALQECFAAAAATLAAPGRLFKNTTGTDPARPAGCSATTAAAAAPLEVEVFFNHLANSTAACGQGAKLVAGAADALVYVGVELDAAKGAAT